MTTNDNNQDGSAAENGAGEGGHEVAENAAVIKELQELKEQNAKLNETVGSLKRENKDLKKPKDTETPEKTEQQSNEPDYARLAFLQSQQVVHPDDQKIVLDEAARLKLPLTDVLQMEHIKSRLTAQNDTRVAQAGMPSGKGRTGGMNKGEVDYYLAHPDETPEDLELHNKVIDARVKQIETDSKFAKVPFIG